MQDSLGQQQQFIQSVYTRNEQRAQQQLLANQRFEAELMRQRDDLTRLDRMQLLQQTRQAWSEVQQTVYADLSRMDNQLRDLSDIITAIHARKLHPLIISEEQLLRMYRNKAIAVHNPKTDIDYQTLAQFMQMTSFRLGNIFYMQIVLPILDKSTFGIFRTYAIPSQIEDRGKSEPRTNRTKPFPVKLMFLEKVRPLWKLHFSVCH